MKQETKHPLLEVDWPWWGRINYRGAYVNKDFKTGLYSLWGHTGLTEYGVDRLIDDSLMTVGKSIKQ